MTVNKKTSDCTIYAFVGTAILAISLVVAVYVGNDFHQSLFVESIIFVGSNILLWAIFISMVNYPYELMTIGSNRKTKKNVVEAEPATEQEQPKQTLPQPGPAWRTAGRRTDSHGAGAESTREPRKPRRCKCPQSTSRPCWTGKWDGSSCRRR